MAEDRVDNDVLKKTAYKQEERLLNLILKNKDLLTETIAMGINPGLETDQPKRKKSQPPPESHFWNPDARLLYKFIYNYFKKYSTTLTLTALDTLLEPLSDTVQFNDCTLNKASIRMFYTKVYILNVSVEDFKLLIEGINDRYIQWQTVKIIQSRVENLIKSTSNQSELVRQLKSELSSMSGLADESYSLTMDFNEGMDKSLEYIEGRRLNLNNNDGAYCGIQALDNIICGFDEGSYNIITGMVNGGKTTLMFNIAFNMAKAGHFVIYVSLEKKAIPFFIRLTCLHSLVDYNRIRRGGAGENGINDETLEAIKMAVKELKEKICPNLTCIQNTQGVKLSVIMAEVEKVRQEIVENNKDYKAKGKKIVFFLDYLGAVGNETTTVGRPDLDAHKTSQDVQSYGKKHGLITFTAAQLKAPASKEIRNKAKKATTEDFSMVEITVEDVGGTKMVLADADNGFGAVLNADQPPTKMIVTIMKARDSESRGNVILDFDGKLGRVCDPILEAGQVKSLNDILYNKNITEEKLRSEDGLFDQNNDFSKENLNPEVASIIENPRSTPIRSEKPRRVESDDDDIF